MEWSLSRVIVGSLSLGRPPGCIGSLSVYLRPTLEFEQDGKREAVARGGGSNDETPWGHTRLS